jgi:hypothetical protein
VALHPDIIREFPLEEVCLWLIEFQDPDLKGATRISRSLNGNGLVLKARGPRANDEFERIGTFYTNGERMIDSLLKPFYKMRSSVVDREAGAQQCVNQDSRRLSESTSDNQHTRKIDVILVDSSSGSESEELLKYFANLKYDDLEVQSFTIV